MAGVTNLIYKGRDILYIDYTGCRSAEEMIKLVKEAQEIINGYESEYLQLSNITNAPVTPGFLLAAKRAARDTAKLAKKRAIVGLDKPGKKIFLPIYNTVLGSAKGLNHFESLEEAKEWLVDGEI